MASRVGAKDSHASVWSSGQGLRRFGVSLRAGFFMRMCFTPTPSGCVGDVLFILVVNYDVQVKLAPGDALEAFIQLLCRLVSPSKHRSSRCTFEALG